MGLGELTQKLARGARNATFMTAMTAATLMPLSGCLMPPPSENGASAETNQNDNTSDNGGLSGGAAFSESDDGNSNNVDNPTQEMDSAAMGVPSPKDQEDASYLDIVEFTRTITFASDASLKRAYQMLRFEDNISDEEHASGARIFEYFSALAGDNEDNYVVTDAELTSYLNNSHPDYNDLDGELTLDDSVREADLPDGASGTEFGFNAYVRLRNTEELKPYEELVKKLDEEQLAGFYSAAFTVVYGNDSDRATQERVLIDTKDEFEQAWNHYKSDE